MDISANWDAFLEMEENAISEIKELEEAIKVNPCNEEAKQKVADIKRFFRQYSSDKAFSENI